MQVIDGDLKVMEIRLVPGAMGGMTRFRMTRFKGRWLFHAAMAWPIPLSLNFAQSAHESFSHFGPAGFPGLHDFLFEMVDDLVAFSFRMRLRLTGNGSDAEAQDGCQRGGELCWIH